MFLCSARLLQKLVSDYNIANLKEIIIKLAKLAIISEISDFFLLSLILAIIAIHMSKEKLDCPDWNLS